MNKYYKWYFAIIKRRQLNPLPIDRCDPVFQYSEEHHIIPQSLGGSDLKENLVNLTFREHYICHVLLVKHYEAIGDAIGYNKMLPVIIRMSGGNSKQDRTYKLNSRLFEALRKKNSIRMSKRMKGYQWSDASKEKLRLSKCNNKFVFNPETKQTKEIKPAELQSYLDNGWVHSQNPESKLKKSIAESGKNNPSYGKKWLHNIHTDEQKYMPAADAQKFISENPDWAFGPSISVKQNYVFRKHRPPRSIDEKRKMSEIMKDTVWIINVNTGKRKRPRSKDVQKWISTGEWKVIIPKV